MKSFSTKIKQKTSPEIKFYKNLALVYHQLENWDLSIQYLETIVTSILSNPENNLKIVGSNSKPVIRRKFEKYCGFYFFSVFLLSLNFLLLP